MATVSQRAAQAGGRGPGDARGEAPAERRFLGREHDGLAVRLEETGPLVLPEVGLAGVLPRLRVRAECGDEPLGRLGGRQPQDHGDPRLAALRPAATRP